MNASLACAGLLALLTGCTVAPRITTDVTRIAPVAAPAKPTGCDIQVFTQAPTDRKFEELAILSAATDSGSFTKKDLASILPTLKEKACAVGADAIIIRNVEQGDIPVGDQYGHRTPTKVFGVAIRFLPARP
jgi:hypothetical protein